MDIFVEFIRAQEFLTEGSLVAEGSGNGHEPGPLHVVMMESVPHSNAFIKEIVGCLLAGKTFPSLAFLTGTTKLIVG